MDWNLTQGKSGTYYTDAKYCTCGAFFYSKSPKHCKHNDQWGKIELIKINREKPAFKSLESSVAGLNKIFGGPFYCSNTPIGMYAKAMTGKTFILSQDAHYLAAQGHNVLYIDTEGGTGSMLEKWGDVFAKRFGEPKGTIGYESAMSFEKLSEYIGYESELIFKQASDKKGAGHMELRVIEKTRIEESPLFKDTKENKIDIVFLDSVSAPIKHAIPDLEQNNPAKSSATAIILGRLIDVSDFLGVPVVFTAHASFNPARPSQSTSADARGGIAFYHSAKRLVYVDGREGKDWTNLRRAWLIRNENTPTLGAMCVMKFGDDGITDAEMPLDEALTAGEMATGKAGYVAEE